MPNSISREVQSEQHDYGAQFTSPVMSKDKMTNIRTSPPGFHGHGRDFLDSFSGTSNRSFASGSPSTILDEEHALLRDAIEVPLRRRGSGRLAYSYPSGSDTLAEVYGKKPWRITFDLDKNYPQIGRPIVAANRNAELNQSHVYNGEESYEDQYISSGSITPDREIGDNVINMMSSLHLGTSVSPNPMAGANATSGHALLYSPRHNGTPGSIDYIPLVSSFFDRRWTNPNLFTYADTIGDEIERAARLHRQAASYSEAKCTWSGQLPVKQHKNPNYSQKVFLGGVPWDITDLGLSEAFSAFGKITVQWPGKENRSNNPKDKLGYVYIIFENDKQVKALLTSCTHDYANGGKYYYHLSSRKMRGKEVQVIPWILGDSNFVRCPSQRLDPNKTVFVGALHGMLTAEGLAHIMQDLFGGVVYAGIDTDKHKYPIGSGRCTMSNQKSYMKAVAAGFVDIKCNRFTKKIQVDPYLENSMCSSCKMQSGPIFCRDVSCYRYFCRSCWQWVHSVGHMKTHHPLMRNKRDN